MMETYLVVIGRTGTGYSAHCPDVLGCAAVGETVEEVLANMKKAMEFHFEGTAEDGEADSQTRRRGFVSNGDERLGCGSIFFGTYSDRHEPNCRGGGSSVGSGSATFLKTLDPQGSTGSVGRANRTYCIALSLIGIPSRAQTKGKFTISAGNLDYP
jgi:predicted RNase H-like HicB family nuclease